MLNTGHILVILFTVVIFTISIANPADATGIIQITAGCENGKWSAIMTDEDGNPISDARVITMEGRETGEIFRTDNDGKITIENSQNTGKIKIIKAKFYDKTLYTEICPEIQTEIPDWVKNNALWWSDDLIDDKAFVMSIEYLIQNHIIKIPQTIVEKKSDTEILIIPAWLKNSASWWAEGKVSEEEFVSSMQFLVKQGIIQVNIGKDFVDYEIPESTEKYSISGTSLSVNAEPLIAFVIYSTTESSCTSDELAKMEKYSQVTEAYLKDNISGKKIIVNEACLHLDKIDWNQYPILLSHLSINRPDLLIFVGDLVSNLELYYEEEAYGIWGCMAVQSNSDCTTNAIIVCECAPQYDEAKTNGGMWVLSHELSHYILKFNSFSLTVVGDAVHVIQYYYDECLDAEDFDACSEYYFTMQVGSDSYQLMNTDYVAKNWRTILAEIPAIEQKLKEESENS